MKLRARHRLMLRAAAVGALVVGIPLAGVLWHDRGSADRLRRDLEYYEQLQEQYSYTSIYVLTRDAVAGEELTGDMFTEQRVQSTDDLSAVRTAEQSQLIGRRLKVSLAKGAALGTDVLYEGAPIADDERRVELSELYLPQTLQEDELVDIRIAFPSGEDYLVVGQKRVYRIIRDDAGEASALQLRFREEELLRYQAACVDVKTYRDCRLYAVQYTGEFQQAAEVFYPVSRSVYELLQWDPNIGDLFVVADEEERRRTLESNLSRFLSEQPAETEPSEDLTDTTEEQPPEEPLTLYTGLPEEA